jgi:hypothetical protein
MSSRRIKGSPTHCFSQPDEQAQAWVYSIVPLPSAISPFKVLQFSSLHNKLTSISYLVNNPFMISGVTTCRSLFLIHLMPTSHQPSAHPPPHPPSVPDPA